MPKYTFELHDGSDGVSDASGVELPDRDWALAYAEDVGRELLSGQEQTARFWRLDVYENHKERVFQIPFANIDPTLALCAPSWRALIADACERHRTAREAIHNARITLRESRALVARSRGRPYLAAQGGRKTIRD